MKLKHFLYFIVFVFISGCSEIINSDEPSRVDSLIAERINDHRGIKTLKGDISMLDAAKVAQLYKSRQSCNSVGKDYYVKNTVAINDKDGKAAVYAVNFQDGYIFISATTLLPPALGEVDHGCYAGMVTDTGEDVIVSDLVETVEFAKRNRDDLKINYVPLWYSYLQPDRNEIVFKTRSMDDDEYWDALNSWYGSYDTEDPDKCRIIQLHGLDINSEIISERTIESIYWNYFYDQDKWEGTDYRWENTAYIVMESYEKNYTTGPLVKTLWHQHRPYNATQYEHLGCVTVAIGQLMRYFQYPYNIDWSAIPLVGCSSATQQFLSELRYKVCGNSSYYGATIGKAKSVLEDYGYTVRKISHSPAEIDFQIYNYKRPVFACGIENGATEGHAWVIDGVNHVHSGTTYKLYYLDPDYYPSFVYKFEEISISGSEGYDITRFHMNWGWENNSTGWFTDRDIVSNADVAFSNNRQELILLK